MNRIQWDDNKLRALVEQGYPNTHIAKMFGCTPLSVANRLRKIGIVTKKWERRRPHAETVSQPADLD